MANNCEYELRIQGPKKSCEEFRRIISYKKDGERFHRIFSADLAEESGNGDCYRMTFCGDCAWSAAASFQSPHGKGDGNITLAEACAKYGVEAEIWTAEPGCCFAEHMQFDSEGNEIYSECHGYQEEENEETGDWEVVEKPAGFFEFNIF